MNGALVAGTLGMAAVTYLPFAFLAYLTPIVSGLIAIRAGGRPLPKDKTPPGCMARRAGGAAHAGANSMSPTVVHFVPPSCRPCTTH